MNNLNKKRVSLLAAAAIALSVLTACGAPAASSSAASSAAASSVASSTAATAATAATASSAASTQEFVQAIAVTFTVTDKDGNATDTVLDATDGETLADALANEGVVSAEEAAAGFVTTVNGVTADYNADKAWWMLVDKDGNMTSVGVGDITLHDGDSYGFVYTIG